MRVHAGTNRMPAVGFHGGGAADSADKNDHA